MLKLHKAFVSTSEDFQVYSKGFFAGLGEKCALKLEVRNWGVLEGSP